MASRVHPVTSSTVAQPQFSIHPNRTTNDGGDSNSQFGGGTSATSGSYASSLSGKSIVNTAGISLFSFVTTLRSKESLIGKENTYMFFWMIFYHAYLIYNSIIVSSITTPLVDDNSTTLTSGISNKMWGVIPGWIWRALYFPLNLASEFYPYYLIVALSVLFVVLQIMTGLAIYYCKWASRKGGKFFEKFKSFVLNSLIFQRTFSLFMLSVHCILITPSTSSIGSLYYFPNEDFSSVLQIIFTAIACIGILLNIVLTMLASYLTVETSAELNRKILFSMYSTSTFILFNLVNQLSLVATILCTSQYSFIASILKIVMNLLLLVIMLKTLPFFRKWENCLYIAFISLKAFTPISPLILQFISTSLDQQVIGGIMTVVTCVLAILSFILGFIGAHFFISRKLKSIRNLISNKADSSNILLTLDDSKKRQDNLALFIRFSMNCKSELKTEEGSDFDLAKHSVNTFVKSIENVDLMIVSALFVSFGGIEEYDDSQSYSIGLALLQKAQRNSPSLAQLFNIMLRNEEIEYHAFHGNNLEVLRKLAVVEKKVKSLSRCHKSFFKELLNDKPSIDKLEHINRTSCSIYNECDTIYDNLLIANRSNKTLLRSYASYLEKYKWEINLARDLFEEAQDNDDDKKNRSTLQISKAHESFHKGTTSRFSIDSQRANLENWDSVSVTAEDNEDRKDHILRTAINTPMSTVVYSVLFFIFCVVSLSTICIVAPIAFSFSQSINQRMSMQEKVCLMTSVPYKLLAQIGALQTEFYSRGNNTEKLLNSTIIYTKTLLDTVGTVIYAGDNNLLMPEVAKEYLKNQYDLKLPIANESLDGTSDIPGYKSTNTSIQFYLSSILTHGKTLLKQFNNIEVLTSHLDDNYPYLFLFYNRISMSLAFNGLCSKFVEESIDVLEANFEQLWITVISVLTTYLLIVMIYFSIIFVHARRIVTELREVFRRIAKDEVGKVYHNFDKKIDDSISSSNSFFKMRNLVMMGSFVLVIIVCLCSVLVVVELQSNTKNSSQSMNVVGSINAVSLRTSRTNFRLLWYFQRVKYLTTLPLIFNEENKQDLLDLRTYWNYVIVGDESTSYQSAVVGKYQDVDYILGDFCNDTIPMEDPCHSLTIALTDYITKSLDYNEVFFGQQKSMTQMVTAYFTDIFYITQTITTNLQLLISTLVEHEKISSIGLTASMIVLCFVATLLYALICYSSLKRYWKERACLRMMLNYVNLELIDNNLILKDYVMSNSIPSSSKITKLMSKFEMSSDEKEDKIEMVKTILNGGVDSAIICDKDGNITIFNNSAEEMFGHSRSQVLGLSIQSLFTDEYSQRITKLISTGESHDAFEAMALRKNKTSFSSKVSVSISIHEKKQILIVFVRDITPEKKQSILIAEEKKKSEDLLLNILPMSMASRLKNGEENLYEKVNDITVFFSDMVGFTAWSSKLQPSELVQILNLIVQGFDKLTEVHLVDKIKTIGDAYFCVSGLHSSKSSDHPERMLRFAIEIMSFLKNINQSNNTAINLRIGLHTGDAVGGVIGFKKFAYDLWGDTINTASRMESTSLPGRIQISRSTYGRVYDLFEFEERMVEVKGKGLSQTYLLKEKHHENPLGCDLEVSYHTPSSSNKLVEQEQQELKNYYENSVIDESEKK
ncbi:hypothetical protein NAEGRDRAFT_68774 [Naegleria gruberi]|uniref:Uncharacterized protein FM180 n=1 Tax=Naegleria gruberi TaxID=5762 RepID=D2VIS0_NAEGR|nr:uncharacterized protein NAEGRDRAFT_68774 [Naegleria gruberi]EFC43400.1 hypothetical protein NAEGRDRAFT_68774 [Naegleria gruberi]|eukprot:XP_002676144.1 hypothetical protein NAEGRDRAFT_68774 [Naegleria gruberi strain NEG-M]